MIFKLIGKHQHYNWGGDNFIPHWLNLPEQDRKNEPYAEYWLGAHRSAPSLVEFEEKWIPLDKLLDTTPELLGEESREKFGDELPYLLKILDVKLPLSIQLHPTKQQAEKGFDAEEKLGIANNAPNRTYKDRNHKPEMMIALSDFWLLHGFKSLTEIHASLEQHPSLHQLSEQITQQGLPEVYSAIMQADQAQLSEWLLPIIEQYQADYQQNKLTLEQAEYWLLYTIEAMDIALDKLDAGLLCFFLFNIVHLKKGEGIYQGAGLPHAYLRGQNIELMAASDNVIRGGLTPKFVDIPALLNTIDYTEITPNIIPAYQASSDPDDNLFLYSTPQATDFALQRLIFSQSQETPFISSSASVLLVMEGEVSLNNEGNELNLKQGEAAFISAETSVTATAEQSGYAVVATLP
ncbi:mannose-6-phosphate isomerase, class I [Otariodibacter oris]|uniref:mannose-6-phosphate isomerase n=1 Tax=Otariodibacter oris TaxID=1032623 RepID=A0A420XEM1_9PAST|nr:mannose-6-phosphate isomerase, class I [Otariodibacter oris]QGM80179.1 mannose-6-phosphate isomerase, class I [Otariodibacter oris]RKR70632.1 mannose-6-phosphate isomerase type 1 [Otariodibacter oris]